MKATVRAVRFDFGGTLYDYTALEAAERTSLLELAQWAGVEAEPTMIQQAHRDALREVFYTYLPKPFYLHRDLFRDAVVGMLRRLGGAADPEHLDRYRAAQWERHARDFRLREGVIATLHAPRARGVHLGIVSNIDEDQLAHLLALASFAEHFDSILSSEYARSCKPDRGIFDEALRRAGCRPEEALFVGDSLAQDVAGANRVGLRSVRLWYRGDRPPPTAGPQPQHVVRRIPEVLELVA